MTNVDGWPAAIEPLQEAAMAAARARQEQLTKPPGSLGRLEELSIQLAGITGEALPSVAEKAVVVMAGDHGVTAEGVSAYPSEVTRQMVLNFLHGGAAINVLAHHIGARVAIVDMGIAAVLPDHPDLIERRLGAGTENIARGSAMREGQASAAVEAGVEIASGLIEEGVELIGTGEMGIGNTTPSSAITAAITGAPVEAVVGRGTGVDDAGLARKRAAVERALATNQPEADNPLDVLAKVGGFEIGGLVGLIFGAASQRVPVVIDGFITGAAALVASGLNPLVTQYMIASHQSVEVGHRIILDHLGLEPLLQLDLRLGEGSGAAVAMGIVDAAARILGEMATFDQAGVSDRE